ncbi:hypothetical protein ES319_D12G100000v1 [Gossypium barbadense]|uniref:Uncharacterized protein n=1 Tax=Gossypium barbadense TaxID=3634 RepID=A0A5J5NWV7_GOSBA|nr:hypothetical protein ES319_D12G100000v1 [Gossypium barbadense]KAB1998595.1 hypothetical protein ES319_D12G100000v1 [Gossypium barbadense]
MGKSLTISARSVSGVPSGRRRSVLFSLILYFFASPRDMQCFQQHIVSIRLTQLCGESRIWVGLVFFFFFVFLTFAYIFLL